MKTFRSDVCLLSWRREGWYQNHKTVSIPSVNPFVLSLLVELSPEKKLVTNFVRSSLPRHKNNLGGLFLWSNSKEANKIFDPNLHKEISTYNQDSVEIKYLVLLDTKRKLVALVCQFFLYKLLPRVEASLWFWKRHYF